MLLRSGKARSPGTPASPATVAIAIVAAVAIAAVTNGLLAAFGLNRTRSVHWPAFAPPGYAIGIVWIVLFAGMGAAFAVVPQKRAVAILIALCLAYPFYTHIAGGHIAEFVGNVVTFAYALWLAIALRARSVGAAVAIGAVAAWVAYATALVIALGAADGWLG